MACSIVIGAQWGDEGKGKIVDVLSEDMRWIVRYQGGNNAGHTVEIGDQRFVLHLIPSGILHEGKSCVIGNGVVLDAAGFIEEMDGLLERGFQLDGRLHISDRAHLVLPYHKLLDKGIEEGASRNIGTPLRGIGPAYGDKVARSGIRCGDLLDPEFDDLVRERVAAKNELLAHLGQEQLDAEQVLADFREVQERLGPFVADTAVLLRDAIARGEKVLFEGAQGTMLDIDHGTYPFVTSSNASSGGACAGSGVAPTLINEVVGVCKAYTTRVGEGPFPTELFDADGEEQAKVGHEFGATTGRPRRCGWFDGVVARYAVMINGITWWTITKLDVLDGFETIKICVAYECDGERLESMPGSIRRLERCTPIYEEVPGWQCDTSKIKRYEDLPANCLAYLERLEELTGVPVQIASVGPRREETLQRG